MVMLQRMRIIRHGYNDGDSEGVKLWESRTESDLRGREVAEVTAAIKELETKWIFELEGFYTLRASLG